MQSSYNNFLSSNVHFVDKEGKETYVTINSYPPKLEKKMKLLSYFKRYMSEHLVKAGADAAVSESDSISRIPHLHTWFRTQCAVVMHLTNGTVQVRDLRPFASKTFAKLILFYIIIQLNFSDHQKIILCPLMQAVTLLDVNKNFRTYPFATIAQHGVTNELYQKLRYAHEKLVKLIEKLSCDAHY